MNTASRTAALLALALLAAPAGAPAQDAYPAPVPDGTSRVEAVRPAPAVAPFRVSAGYAPASRTPDAAPAAAFAAPSASRHLLVGAGIGAVAGAAFGLAVVSFADCGGPDCSGERVLGVASLTLGGAAIGALVGGLVYLVRS